MSDKSIISNEKLTESFVNDFDAEKQRLKNKRMSQKKAQAMFDEYMALPKEQDEQKTALFLALAQNPHGRRLIAELMVEPIKIALAFASAKRVDKNKQGR